MQHEDRIDIKPWGVPVSIRGLNMFLFFSLVCITVYTIYYLSEVVSKEHMLISNNIEAQTKAIEKQNDVLREQNYILLADEQETLRIRHAYRMPQSLREKLNGTE